MKPELYTLPSALGAVGKPMFPFCTTAGSVGWTTGIRRRVARAGRQSHRRVLAVAASRKQSEGNAQFRTGAPA